MNDLIPYSEVQKMADQVVRSRMFPGITTPEAAVTLMLLCQSEGLHPMQAMMRYHLIQGRPSMKADAMLAEFMRRGGTVDWTEFTDEKVTAVFTSAGVPKGVTVSWTIADAKRAGVTGNPTWQKYPRQMLKARVASDGVRMADPAVNQGRYTPEEVQDFDEPKTVKADAEVYPHPGVPGLSTAVPLAIAPDHDMTPELEASIAYAQEAKAKSKATVEDAQARLIRCPECQSYTNVYPSTQTGKNAGRLYRQCETAHKNIEYLIAEEGFTAPKAAALNAKHYRQWVEPPRKNGETHGEEPETAGESEPPPKSEAPASIFDVSQIERDVAAKLAAERHP